MDSFNQLIEQIKFHLNDYLKEKKVEFTHGKIKCLNPNHEDNHPSMSYVPNTGDKILHCFSCGASYNILHVVKILDSKPNRGPGLLQSTIPWLCEKFSIPYNPEDISVSPEQIEISEYRELYESAAQVFKELATYENTNARKWNDAFCKDKGIGSVNWVKFKERLCQHGGYEEDYFITRDITSKLFNEDRITYVIKDHYGRVCGFAARDMKWHKEKKTPKFINTSGFVPIYQKGKILYGAHLLGSNKHNSEERIDIFEGYGDWITARQAGHNSCVAVCGTSLTSNHIEALKDMGYIHINLVFDGDSPGKAKMAAYLEQYSSIPGIRFTVTLLPFEDSQAEDQRDPDDFIIQYGLTEFMSVRPTSAFDWKLLELKDKGIRGEEIARKLLPYVINETSAIERGNMCVVLAQATGLSEEDLRSEVRNRTNKTIRDIKDYAITKLRNATDATEIQEIFDSAHGRIRAATTQKDHAVFHIAESANHFDKWLTDVQNPVSGISGWKTGFPTLDDPTVLGGIPKKDSIMVFAGPPNHGKSAVLINLVKNLMIQDNKNMTILLWYLDDSRNVAWSKLMASMMGLPILDIKRPDRRIFKDPVLHAKYLECCDFMKTQLNEKNPRLIVKGHEIGNDLMSAEKWIKEVQAKTGNNVVLFIDAVNDMSTGDPSHDGNERLKYIKCFDWFQRTTEMLEYTVLTVCHVTKSGISKGKPDVFDASETAKILYSAKFFGMVYSELDYFSQKGMRNQTPKYWQDTTITPDANGPQKDNKQPIVELAVQKSKESAFKGSIYFRHKSEACWMDEIRGAEYENLIAWNEEEIRKTASSNLVLNDRMSNDPEFD